jgi:hypothetical protein
VGAASAEAIPRLPMQLKKKKDHWVGEHPNVRPSPITRDTLLVKNKVTGKKKRVGKLLLEIPDRELHNNMLLPVNKDGSAGAFDENHQIILSDTTLQKLLPKEL